MSKGRKILNRIFYGCFLLAITFLALEIILRFYNPFQFRLKGDQIILPVNTQLTIQNSINPKLDSVIVNTRNELGFRGPELPADPGSRLSIITVGGSTTECHFNNDDRTWPALLAQKLDNKFNRVWLNNAGLDGHSTFGHQVLLQDHLVKIRPKVILLLTGVNDIESDRPSFHDQRNKQGAWTDLKHYLVSNSEVLSLFVNIARGWKAQKAHNTSGVNVDPKQLPRSKMTDQQAQAQLALQQQFLPGYRLRVQELIDTCPIPRSSRVFITQPLLYGNGIDSVTQVDLAGIEHKHMSGKCAWQVPELYNDVLRKTAIEKEFS